MRDSKSYVVTYRRMAWELAKFYARSIADACKATEETADIPSNTVWYVGHPDQAQGAFWSVTVPPDFQAFEAARFPMFDDGRTPTGFDGEAEANWANAERMLDEAETAEKTNEPVITRDEATQYLQRAKERLLMRIENVCRHVGPYRAWVVNQRAFRSTNRNYLRALQSIQRSAMPRKPLRPAAISSRWKPATRDGKTPKRKQQKIWGLGVNWRRNGYDAHYWHVGRPPLPESAWLANYRKRRRAQRKNPSRPYTYRKRKRLTEAPRPLVLIPRPTPWEFAFRETLPQKRG